MLYRENGQFKTSYRADQQIFPILQDRLAIVLLLVAAYVVVPAPGQRLPVPRHPDPVPDHRAGRAGREHPGRLLRPDLARARAPSWPWAPMAPTTSSSAFPTCRWCRRILLGGLCATAFGILFGLPSLRVKGLYLAVATLAAQFFADWMFLRIKWLTNDSPSGSIGGLGPAGVRHADRERRQQVLVLPRDPDGARAAGQEPGAQRDRPRVDGHPRHGRGGRRDRHPPDVRQAQRLRGQLVHRRRRRRAVGLRLPGRLGAGGVLGRPVVPPAVHGDHRRPGLHHGRVLRRRLHRGAADRAEPVAAAAGGAVRPEHRHRRPVACRTDDLRRADRLVPRSSSRTAWHACGPPASRSCGCGRSRTERALLAIPDAPCPPPRQLSPANVRFT